MDRACQGGGVGGGQQREDGGVAVGRQGVGVDRDAAHKVEDVCSVVEEAFAWMHVQEGLQVSGGQSRLNFPSDGGEEKDLAYTCKGVQRFRSPQHSSK